MIDDFNVASMMANRDVAGDPDPQCKGCASRDEMIRTLSERIDELEIQHDEIRAELVNARKPRPTLEPAAIDWGW